MTPSWSAFDESIKTEIEVYDLIFKPNLNSSIKTADLPVAGRGYSADSVKMVFELVNFVNKLHPDMWRGEPSSRKRKAGGNSTGVPLADDIDGATTIAFMRSVRKAAVRIAGNEPASLGLHPAVYFYSATGRFQPAAFLATVAFIQELEDNQAIAKFTQIRAEFEDFLIKYKYFLNQIVRNYGSLQRAVTPILTMHRTLSESIREGCTEDRIVENLKAQPPLKSSVKEITDEDREHGRNFSVETKNFLILREIIETAPRCGICNARLHFGSMSFDHKIRKEDGGTGVPENAQFSHFYCNTGYKESLHAARL